MIISSKTLLFFISGRGLLPWQQRGQQERRPGFEQTQRRTHMGRGGQLQLLREPEGGAGSAEAQRQLRRHQEPRETQLLVQSGPRPVPEVSGVSETCLFEKTRSKVLLFPSGLCRKVPGTTPADPSPQVGATVQKS